MGRIDVVLPDDKELQLRIEVARRYVGKKGSLAKAVGEAIDLWLKQGDQADGMARIVRDQTRSARDKHAAIANLASLGRRGYSVLAELASDPTVAPALQTDALEFVSLDGLRRRVAKIGRRRRPSG